MAERTKYSFEIYGEGYRDALTEALHPEFGYEWASPDGKIYLAIQSEKSQIADLIDNLAVELNDRGAGWMVVEKLENLATLVRGSNQ